MSIFLRGACALLLAAGFVSGARAQSKDTGATNAVFDSETSLADAIKQTSCDCEPYGCDVGCAPCDLGNCGPGGLGGQVFIGAEWLSVRANFSEATAYRVFDLNTNTETFEQFNMGYGSSYRVFGGYQLCNCGGAIQFTYTNFNTDGGFTSAPTGSLNTDGATFTAPFELALEPGDLLVGRARVNVDNYDLGFSKTIPLGCPLSCGGCGECGDCCDPCCGPVCPAWDITWNGGIRFASVDSSLAWNTVRTGNTASPNRSAVSLLDFEGAGLRFGLTGRRYFGRSGMLSAYIRGDISLLLGDVTNYVPDNTAGYTGSLITTTQVVPVTEIEAGLTGYLTQNLSVSAGYMLSAWHDLGHRAEYDYSLSGTQTQLMDDANMMTFDGFFVRAVAAF